MKRITIYFDTNFYINLCHEKDESEVAQTIHAFNLFNVRYVISDLLIWELISGHNRDGNDEKIVSCMNQLALAPYCTGTSSSLNVLLYSGQERVTFASQMQFLLEQMALADSISIMADRDLPPDKRAKLEEAHKPLLDEFGFPAHPEQNVPQFMAAIKRMLATLEINIDLPDEVTPENARQVFEQFRDYIGHAKFEEVMEGNRIRNSSTQNDNRPYEVATGTAKGRTARNLGGTLRDTQHMNTFVTHRHEIDYLQVDQSHYDRIHNTKPIHRILELELGDRLFFANNLKEIRARVEELVNQRL